MFIIFAHQRSGTHLLATLLNSHPDLRCYDEVLIAEDNIHFVEKDTEGGQPRITSTKTKHRNEMLGEKKLTELKENEGAIVMYNQFLLADKRVQETVENAKIIHLIRDAEDRAESNLRVDLAKAGQMGGITVHSFDGKEQEVFPIDEDMIKERRGEIEKIKKAAFDELPEDLNLYGIAYEEITGGKSITEWPKKKARSLLEFLEVEPRTLTTELKKPKYKSMFEDIDGTFKNKQIRKFLKHDFEFDNQHKETYNDWLKALKKAIERSTKGKKCFTGLSSGYDSGSLTWEMQEQGVDYKAYIIPRGENGAILKERAKIIESGQVVSIKDREVEKMREFLEENVEDARYVIMNDGVRTQQRILEDEASWGLGLSCKLAQEEGYDTYISTQGADEVLSDYGLWNAQSTFNGTFPEKLEEWTNFKHGCNWSYMMKEERVPESFGVKVGFPFLDIDLVQEFLWLSPRLKNKYYKAPLHIYLTRNEIPFEEGVKRGFGLY